MATLFSKRKEKKGLSEKEVVLKSGKKVAVKLPPINLEAIYEMQRKIVKQALVKPQLLAILSQDEFQELVLAISNINMQYWNLYAQKITGK